MGENHSKSRRLERVGVGVENNDQPTHAVSKTSKESKAFMSTLRRKSAETLQARMLSSIENGRSWIRFRQPGLIIEDSKVWIINRRCHHGLVGALCVGVGAAKRQLALILGGAILCWDDKEDWPWPMSHLTEIKQ